MLHALLGHAKFCSYHVLKEQSMLEQENFFIELLSKDPMDNTVKVSDFASTYNSERQKSHQLISFRLWKRFLRLIGLQNILVDSFEISYVR